MITVRGHISMDWHLTTEAYTLYEQIFTPINSMAAQRHLMTRAEFGKLTADPRITKLLAHNDVAELVGMAAVTNQLPALSLVSDPYYARHYPNHHARGAIWYVAFVGVRPRTPHAFRELVRELYSITMSRGPGLSVMDFCAYNEAAVDVPGVTLKLLSQFDPNSRHERIDVQATHLYRFDPPGQG